MDRETFGKGMFILTAAYEKALDQDTVEVYYSFLNHLTPAELERAARRHIARSSFFPKINELLEASKADVPTPTEAWTRLIAAAEAGTDEPQMDGTTHQALATIGGWGEFLYWTYDDLKFRFKDFKVAYEEAQARGQEVVAVRPQVGQTVVGQIEGPAE